jgi:hypothetical protein
MKQCKLGRLENIKDFNEDIMEVNFDALNKLAIVIYGNICEFYKRIKFYF